MEHLEHLEVLAAFARQLVFKSMAQPFDYKIKFEGTALVWSHTDGAAKMSVRGEGQLLPLNASVITKGEAGEFFPADAVEAFRRIVGGGVIFESHESSVWTGDSEQRRDGDLLAALLPPLQYCRNYHLTDQADQTLQFVADALIKRIETALADRSVSQVTAFVIYYDDGGDMGVYGTAEGGAFTSQREAETANSEQFSGRGVIHALIPYRRKEGE